MVCILQKNNNFTKYMSFYMSVILHAGYSVPVQACVLRI